MQVKVVVQQIEFSVLIHLQVGIVGDLGFKTAIAPWQCGVQCLPEKSLEIKHNFRVLVLIPRHISHHLTVFALFQTQQDHQLLVICQGGHSTQGRVLEHFGRHCGRNIFSIIHFFVVIEQPLVDLECQLLGDGPVPVHANPFIRIYCSIEFAW